MALTTAPVAGECLAQPFTPIETTIRSTALGLLLLGDFNGDGYLDVFAANHEFAEIYLSRGTGDLSFHSPLPIAPEAASTLRPNASAYVADFDNDGSLDILFTGEQGGTYLYRNLGSGNFLRAQPPFPDLIKRDVVDIINSSSLSGVDVDNDGAVDILMVGFESGGNSPGLPVSKLFLGEITGEYTEHFGSLPAIITGPHAWGDYDHDGDLDLIAACYCDPGIVTTRIFRNDGNGRFVDTGVVLLEGVPGSVQWADYDDDGDLDILIAGRTIVFEQGFDVVPYLAIIRNDGGTFTLDQQELPDGVYWARWADMSNNGRLDLLVNTSFRSAPDAPVVAALRVYENEDGRFTNEIATLPPVWNGAIAIGDLDGDGDLDLILSPASSTAAGNEGPRTLIYRNDAPRLNTVPSIPRGLHAEFLGNEFRLYWDPSLDAETPEWGLTYNIRVGTTSQAGDIVSPMSLTDGTRMVPRGGNAGANTRWVLRGLDPNRRYFWSVQAVDHGLAASPFSEEAEFGSEAVTVEESVPATFGLMENYPNPFNLTTTVRFGTAHAGNVRLVVYNVFGREVAVLQDGPVPAGEHEVTLHAQGLPSGVYVARLSANGYSETRSLTLVR